MNIILSKMVGGVTSSPTGHSTADVSSLPDAQHSSSVPPLVACFQQIQTSGCVGSESMRRLDSLLTAVGPVCFTNQLVQVIIIIIQNL